MVMLDSPNISGSTPVEQIQQLNSYLIQFKEQLEIALGNISSDNLSPEMKNSLSDMSQSVSDTKEMAEGYEQKLEKIKNQIITSSDVVKSEDYVEATKVESNRILSTVGNRYIAQTTQFSKADDLVDASLKEIRQSTMEQEKTAVSVTCLHSIVTNIDGNVESSVVKPYIRLGLIGSKDGVDYCGARIGQYEGTVKVVNGQHVVDEHGNYVYDLRDNPYATETTKDGYSILENNVPIQWFKKGTSCTKKLEVQDSIKIGQAANGFLNIYSTASGIAGKWSET